MFNLNCHFSRPLHPSSHCITTGRMNLQLSFVIMTCLFFFFVCLLLSVDLLGLLKWRSNTSLLQQNLRQLMKVEGGEVVKVRRLKKKSSRAMLPTVLSVVFALSHKTNFFLDFCMLENVPHPFLDGYRLAKTKKRSQQVVT